MIVLNITLFQRVSFHRCTDFSTSMSVWMCLTVLGLGMIRRWQEVRGLSLCEWMLYGDSVLLCAPCTMNYYEYITQWWLCHGIQRMRSNREKGKINIKLLLLIQGKKKKETKNGDPLERFSTESQWITAAVWVRMGPSIEFLVSCKYYRYCSIVSCAAKLIFIMAFLSSRSSPLFFFFRAGVFHFFSLVIRIISFFV